MKKVLILTKEYPPYVYGGAGVHVHNLTRELARLIDVEVRCFGSQHGSAAHPGLQPLLHFREPFVRGSEIPRDHFARIDPKLRKAIEPIAVDLEFLREPIDADVVHCHTWYSMLAGLWAKILYDIPLVVTTHSLEPLRPWKAEQLGRGYQLSSWVERVALEAADAVIAVSSDTRREVIAGFDVDPSRVYVIHNGIDLEDFVRKDPRPALNAHGIDPERPYVLFVGRIARQKGVIHLLEALEHIDPGLQVVLCAGEADTVELLREMEGAVVAASRRRSGVHWITERLPIDSLVGLYSGASVFVCPSVYEPFGIINLEAMACSCPVVASAVGGIPEVVVDGETGVLVPFESAAESSSVPADPRRFALDLARAVNRLAADPGLQRRMGDAGRQRVEARFSWPSIARQTLDLYAAMTQARSVVPDPIVIP
jgi:starch synthase